MRRYIVTAVAAIAAAMVLLLIGLTGAGGVAAAVLRIVAGLPLILVLPGYALSALVLPGRPAAIGPLLWRAMWVVGLSLAVTVLGGLLLNLTPVGLTRTSWTISLTAVTLLATAVSARRSARDLAVPWTRAGMRMAAGYAVAAVAISGAAIGLAIASAGWQHSPGFAQLWLVPASSTAGSGRASLGVRSGYSHAQAFHLVLRRGTDAALSWNFTLGSGQTWQHTISAPAGQHVTAQLTVTGQQSAAQTVGITS